MRKRERETSPMGHVGNAFHSPMSVLAATSTFTSRTPLPPAPATLSALAPPPPLHDGRWGGAWWWAAGKDGERRVTYGRRAPRAVPPPPPSFRGYGTVQRPRTEVPSSQQRRAPTRGRRLTCRRPRPDRDGDARPAPGSGDGNALTVLVVSPACGSTASAHVW
jgi:hypothetical protein